MANLVTSQERQAKIVKQQKGLNRQATQLRGAAALGGALDSLVALQKFKHVADEYEPLEVESAGLTEEDTERQRLLKEVDNGRRITTQQALARLDQARTRGEKGQLGQRAAAEHAAGQQGLLAWFTMRPRLNRTRKQYAEASDQHDQHSSQARREGLETAVGSFFGEPDDLITPADLLGRPRPTEEVIMVKPGNILKRAISAVTGYRDIVHTVEKFAPDFEARGYKRVSG